MNEPITEDQQTTINAIEAFVIGRYPRAEATGVTIDDHLLEQGILDSVGLLLLVNFIEETFGVAVSDVDLDPENFTSIRTISGFVEARRGR